MLAGAHASPATQLLAFAPADRLLALATPAELAALAAEPEEEGDACEELAALSAHVPDAEAVALALAPLPAHPPSKQPAPAGAVAGGCNEFEEEEDGDRMDELEGAEELRDFFDACPDSVPNEQAWVKAACEIMRNRAVRSCAAAGCWAGAPHLTLVQNNLQVNVTVARAAAPGTWSTPAPAPTSALAARLLVPMPARKHRIVWLRHQGGSKGVATITSYEGERVGHVAARLVRKLDGARGHLPRVVAALSETEWQAAVARHAAHAVPMKNWLFGLKA